MMIFKVWKRLILFTGIMNLLLSCGENREKQDTKGEILANEEVKEYRFRLMPDLNTVYQYQIVNENITEIEVDGTETGNETKMEMLLSYSVDKDTSGLYDFSMVYDKFKLNVKALDQEKLIDADNAAQSFDPVEKVFGAFKNATLRVQADENGSVMDVSGLKELTDKMHSLANGNPQAIEMLNTSLRQYIGQENIRSVFEKTFRLLPDSILHEGDEWTVSEPVTSDIKANIENKYRVKSIKNGVITITNEEGINLENEPATVEGTSVTVNLKGNQTGEIKIETTTGMLLFSSSNLKLKGDMIVLGKIIPLKLEIINTTRKVSMNE